MAFRFHFPMVYSLLARQEGYTHSLDWSVSPTKKSKRDAQHLQLMGPQQRKLVVFEQLHSTFKWQAIRLVSFPEGTTKCQMLPLEGSVASKDANLANP